MNQVNIKWQMLATIFILTGLYAFKRIDKLLYGILVYAVTFVYAVIAGTLSVIFFDELGNFGFIITATLYIIPIIVPMFYIKKWSEQWNKSIQQQTKTV